MALLTEKVEVVFDETPVYDGIGFTLDDTEKGVLNQPYYLLDGRLNFVDVTSEVASVSINRGRSRQLDQYQTGNATISFNNLTRSFDPLNTASPYYPYVIPRRYVRISTNGIFTFAGLVNTWNIEYKLPDDSIAVANCTDAFSVLSGQSINAFTPTEELTGSRVSTILNLPEISFTGTAVSIDAGVSTVGAFAVSDQTDALGYLRQVEKSEQGYLFATKNNTLKFRDRSSVLAQTGGVTFSDTGSPTSQYMTLQIETGDELIYNRIVATSPAGVAQTVTDATSIAKYDTVTLEASDLLNATTTEVESIANLLLGQYKEPEVRFTGLSQQLVALSGTNQNLLLGLDLTDLATVTRSFSTGTPSSVTKYVLVEGISHSITPGSHTMTFRFASLSQIGLILDSGFFGLLDNASL